MAERQSSGSDVGAKGGMRKGDSFLGGFRYFLMLAVVCCLVGVPALAQDTPAATEELPFPRISIPTEEFDFGRVSQGTKVNHEFLVRNSGQSTLNITRVVAACGCTATSIDTQAIEPGAEGKIAVEFDTAGFSGEKVKTVRIYSNDPDNSVKVVSMRGTIDPTVLVTPRRVFFGDIIQGSEDETVQKEILVEVKEGSNITLKSVRAFSESIVLEELEGSDLRKRFRVSVSPEVSPGELRDRVVVSLSGDRRRTINVPVFANVRGPISLEPVSLSFGVLDADAPLSRTVRIENSAQSPLEILGVKTSHKAVQAELKPIEEGRLFVVKVTVDPRQVSRDLRTSVRIKTNSKEQQELSLSVYGIVPPKI